MTKYLNYLLVVVVVGLLTQSLVAIIATLIGIKWARLKIQYWNRAKNQMKPPSGGIKINKSYNNANQNNLGLAF